MEPAATLIVRGSIRKGRQATILDFAGSGAFLVRERDKVTPGTPSWVQLIKTAVDSRERKEGIGTRLGH